MAAAALLRGGGGINVWQAIAGRNAFIHSGTIRKFRLVLRHASTSRAHGSRGAIAPLEVAVLRGQVGTCLEQADTGEHVVRRANKPNHFLMRAWSFAVLARKSSLQALRQKRRPQWWWQTRPSLPPQFGQRLSGLAMRLASDLEVGRATFGMRGRSGMATNFVASSDVDRIGIAHLPATWRHVGC